MITARAYDMHVEQLFEKMRRVTSAFNSAGIPYRVVGGIGIFLHTYPVSPENARMTDDIDLALHRTDLGRIQKAAESAGFQYRHVAGMDMLVDETASRPRSDVHFVFALEKVRAGDLEPIPFSDGDEIEDGILIASVPDLLCMKLTSFRLKDKVHIQDMDGAGLITPEIENQLSQPLRDRLAEVRATR
jgi:hypothetical protein